MRIEATGPASARTMWEAYAEPSRWTSWAPHIRDVHPMERIRPGLAGEVSGPAGVRARFQVTAVDAATRSWTWRVEVGPARLTIAHEVAEGRTALVLDGPAPAVLAYAPIARLALARLVHLEA